MLEIGTDRVWGLKPALSLRRIQKEISVWSGLFVSEGVVDVNKNESMSRVLGFNSKSTCFR